MQKNKPSLMISFIVSRFVYIIIRYSAQSLLRVRSLRRITAFTKWGISADIITAKTPVISKAPKTHIVVDDGWLSLALVFVCV